MPIHARTVFRNHQAGDVSMPCVTRNLTRRNPSAERMCDLGRWKNTFSNQILAELSKKQYVRRYVCMYVCMYVSIYLLKHATRRQTTYLYIGYIEDLLYCLTMLCSFDCVIVLCDCKLACLFVGVCACFRACWLARWLQLFVVCSFVCWSFCLC